MRCTTCGHSLFGVASRTCPQCGAPFVPSTFEFAPRSVRFCCPHCQQAYMGTGPRGELEPRSFSCIGCLRPIDIDQMIVSPIEAPPGAATGGIAPPTTPGVIAKPARESTWHVPIGIITIVLASGGILANVWGAMVTIPALSAMGIWAPLSGSNPFTAIRAWSTLLTVLYACGAVLAVTLLVAGILVLQRRVWGARLMLLWAGAKILLAVALTFATVAMQRAQMQSMTGSTTMPPPPVFVDFMTIIGAAISLLWSCALPIFMLIWFTRKGIQASVNAWPEAPAP